MMDRLRKIFIKFYLLKEGSTLIEIALYIALVVIVCIVVITALGDKLQGVFQKIVDSL
ncbi:MAG: Flp family type IVb pilin [Cyanobacteria bacterium]|nr:Flp family type IVb pilin [Cyanobacteriota bacterium]